MKKIILLLVSTLFAGVETFAQTGAQFDYFSYKGDDSYYNEHPLPNESSFYNPILPGWYSDPGWCSNGKGDYFLVTSTFTYFPGVPIFHSRDLVNWKQIGHVLDRPSQLVNMKHQHISGGIFAPAISYNPHNRTYYMITTNVGAGNFFVKTQDPWGSWSDPYPLPAVSGIDPSFCFDDNGKAYIVFNSDPDGKPEYSGHRAIRCIEFDVAHDTTVGKSVVIINKGVRAEDKPIWIEGPHLYKLKGRYYLMCAEGGTSDWHSEVLFRSDNPMSGFKPWDKNPILTQRHLPKERPYPITCVGHADVLQTSNGEWWAVCLATRPIDGKFENLGRETFMMPVKWTDDGWFYMLQGDETVPMVLSRKGVKRGESVTFGNFERRDDFNDNKLGMEWMTLRAPATDLYSLTAPAGSLSLKYSEVSAREKDVPAIVLRRIQHHCFTAQTKMIFRPADEKDRAGIILFKDETSQYFLYAIRKGGKNLLQVERVSKKGSDILAGVVADDIRNNTVELRITSDGLTFSFYYSADGKTWKPVFEKADAQLTSTAAAGGFTGTTVGVYAVREGQLFTNPVIYSDVPDVDVIRVGDTYYMVSTTMHLMPGCPIMRSKDLVNWKIISYVFDEIKDSPLYDLEGGNVYGQGQWASSLRYHNGKYYVLFCTNRPQRTYIYSATDPAGKWTQVMNIPVRYHDASLLFDDDGKVYLAHGNGRIRITELKSDLSDVMPDGLNVEVLPGSHNVPGLLEGTHINKYNGKYYMFLIWWPRGGIRTELCFRSDKIEGPYEMRTILSDDLGLRGRGVAQGCIVDTPEGEWYGMLFQDHGAVGRTPVLMPCRWINGWPMLGERGKVPPVMKKPVQSEEKTTPIVTGDDFNADKLALNWEWNHNPDNTLWSLTERKGYMRLKTGKVVNDIFSARNTLSQRTEGPHCSGMVSMDVSHMKEGDVAGFGAFCAEPGLLEIRAEADGKYLVMTDRQVVKERVKLNENIIYLRMDCDFTTDTATFHYSLDNLGWTTFGTPFHMIYNLVHFMGNRFAIFNYATKQAGGYVDVDWFMYRKE